MAARIKKGDTVQIIAGDHKGTTGNVMRIVKDGKAVVIAGVNLSKKHVKPSQKYPQGGQIQVEQPINISNVLPVAKGSTKGTRVRFEEKDGVKRRVATDGKEISVVDRPSKK